MQKMEADVCVLWWCEKNVDLSDDHSVESFRKFLADMKTQETVNGKGFIYCIEGIHDACPIRSPLYIGMSSAKDGPIQRFYGMRPSFGYFSYRESPGKMYLYSDAWDLTIRVASVSSDSGSDVKRIEEHLIRFHKPPYNSADITGYLTQPAKSNADSDNLVIINGGAKGTLLPVLASWYFAPPSWWPADAEG